MSVVNSALNKLAQQDENAASKLHRAEVPKLKKSHPIVWLVAGFSLSLAIGSYAVSQQQPSLLVKDDLIVQQPDAIESGTVLNSISSPTRNQVQPNSVTVFHPQPKAQPITEKSVTAKPVTAKSVATGAVESQAANLQPKPVVTAKQATQPALQAKTSPAPKVHAPKQALATPIEKPILIAKAKVTPESEMVVQQVDLTPQQLADKSIARAEAALSSNDIKTAFTEYHKALKLVPSDEKTRQKLAAIYYGRKDSRRAINLLQQGIAINEKGGDLRFALAKLLVKEEQPEAALSSLTYIPDSASDEYLALRAGLAQQLKNVEVAALSYQMLTERDPNNARWWLGLAIQQERQLQYADAKSSYTKALGLVGVSKQTQAFVRDRLQLLNSLEGIDNGN
ncbi:hypothetical protein [Vibrio gallicus]|uniref:hypothetical protein n=1 Tax=Vibrio gallicus TaxID=190897 RepID=UPI0021C29570|nr:hypothetical protein [Vibrio gallicus]